MYNEQTELATLSLKLTFRETAVVVVLWLGMLMLPLAPLASRYAAGGVILFLSVAFLTRNILPIATVAAVLNLAGRFYRPGSSFHDQHWVQWSSMSSLLTGHNIFATSPIYNFSLSSYMPMGDLFGGLLIAIGIQQYWLVWHVLIVCLVALPLVLSPSFTTLLMFIAFSSFYPFSDYTTGGGTLEIAYAVTIAAIALFRTHRLGSYGLVLFAFAVMFRQPATVMAPFLVLILWRERDIGKLRMFGFLLFLFGGIYILEDPPGAFHYLYEVWNGYHQELFNTKPGLVLNYSIASLPQIFGVSDAVAWYNLRPFYGPILLAGLGSLFVIAWSRKNREEILFLGVLASASVYVLSRGFSQYSYLCTAFFPLAGFWYPVEGRPSVEGRRFAKSLVLVMIWIGGAPAIFYILTWASRKADELRPRQVIHALEVRQDQNSAAPQPVLDGSPTSHAAFSMPSTVRFRLPNPERLSGVRLSCDPVSVQIIKGVPMPYPSDTQMRGAITEGELEWSADGTNFLPLEHFHNAATYCIWPVTIAIPETPRPIAAIRLKATQLYLDQQEWVLGNVEFLRRR